MTTLVGRGAAVVLVVVAVTGCGARMAASSPAPSIPASPSASPSMAAATPPTSTEPAAATPSQPVAEPPLGLPVMPDAHPAQLPGDPGVVSRWTVEEVGSAAYDWYVAALPAAGFEIVGTYPSERAALIRFTDSGGQIWQLLTELVDDRTQISLQTDRP